MELPQLWELGDGAESPLGESEDLARAYDAEVGVVDRLRGWRDENATLWTLDSRVVSGMVGEVYRDAVLIVGERVNSLIPMTATVRCRGPYRPHRVATGVQRASGLGAVRARIGREIIVHLVGLPAQQGVVTVVGADHVGIAAPCGEDLLPWAHTATIEWATG